MRGRGGKRTGPEGARGDAINSYMYGSGSGSG